MNDDLASLIIVQDYNIRYNVIASLRLDSVELTASIYIN